VAPDHVQPFADFDANVGGPAIVQTGDGLYTLAVPTSNLEGAGWISFYTVQCFDDLPCDAPTSARTLASRTGRAPTIVRVGSLRNGYALVSIEPGVSGPEAHLYLLDSNWQDVSDDVALPIVTTPGEQIVAVQMGSVFDSDDLTATVVVAALLRTETTTTDRIWLGGYRACITR